MLEVSFKTVATDCWRRWVPSALHALRCQRCAAEIVKLGLMVMSCWPRPPAEHPAYVFRRGRLRADLMDAVKPSGSAPSRTWETDAAWALGAG